MKGLNWDDIPLFLSIADAGSLNGAARTLDVNHSTIFRRLNALEENLQVRLFDRLPSGYVLTPAGERMRELAREADLAVQSIERDLAGRDLKPKGTVRLTTAPNIARTLLPSPLAQLRKSHPEIMVEVVVGNTDYDLSRREADIAVRATSRPPENLVGRKLMDLGWNICGPTGARRRLPKSIEELSEFDLIGADNALMRLAAFEEFESRFASRIVARANDFSTMAAMVRAGIGLALLPSDQQEDGVKRLFEYEGHTGELWILAHPDLRRQARVDVVWNTLVERLRASDPAT